FTARGVTESRTRPPEIVGGELRDVQSLRVGLDNMPDNLLSHPFAPYGPRTAHTSEHFPTRDSGGRKPIIKKQLHPIRNWNCPNVATFSDKIHDGPTILASLKMVETEIGQFSPSETTAEQDSNDCTVSLTF